MMLAKNLLIVISATCTFTAAFAQEFPVTIVHEKGKTTIEVQPERVVSIGIHEQDFLYALGIAPVGVHEWWGEYPFATWPWAEAARIAVGAEPDVLMGWEINVEWVATLQPDLIVASYYSDLEDDTYALLSKIAPVVMAPAGYPAWGAPWQEELRLLGRATGTEDTAEEIIADLGEKIVAARADHPELEGKTAATAYYFDGVFRTYNSADTAHRFLSSFGLVIPPEYDEMATETGHLDVSPENIEIIDLDLLVVGGSKEDRIAVEALSVFQATRAAREGRAFWIGDGVASGALSFQTPLSLEYLIDTLPAAFEAAVDGDPTTKIPNLEIE